MNIGEMVQRIKDRRPEPNPDGGIGGLTPAEESQLSDLLNQDYPCECGVCGCNSPLIEPKSRL